ncbi:MAG: hypothetical protein HOE90_07285 [Bacteriovoracaceae bacterium]|jgi:hypothetical protein|nr:hypothetical protein [Bacteriovoracaceae bacterium]
MRYLLIALTLSTQLYAQSISFNGKKFAPLDSRNYYQNKFQSFYLEKMYNSVLFPATLDKSYYDPRSFEQYKKAVGELGSVTEGEKFDNIFIRVQDFSLTPSLASLAVISKFAKEKIIVLYYGIESDPVKYGFKKATHFDGSPTPVRLKNQLYQIGRAGMFMIPYTSASDNFLRNLSSLEKSGVFKKNQKNLLISHGIGVVDSILTLKRLNDNGAISPFSKFWAFSCPDMTSNSAPFVVRAFRDYVPYLFRASMGGRGHAEGLKLMTEKKINHYLSRPHFDQFVDLSISGVLGLSKSKGVKSPISPVFRIVAQFEEINQPSTRDFRKFLKSISSGRSTLKGSLLNNGVVTYEHTLYGKDQLKLKTNVDHNSIWGDYHAMIEVFKGSATP